MASAAAHAQNAPLTVTIDANTNLIQKLADRYWKGGKIADTVPPQSVTPCVLPK